MKLALRQSLVILVAACMLSACAAPKLPPRDTLTPGQTITVNGSQNVYAVAKQYNVSMRDIIVLNNLQPPFTLRPGQNLVLPSASPGASVYGGYNSGSYVTPYNRMGGDGAPMPNAAPSDTIVKQELPPVEAPPTPVPVKQGQTHYVLTSPPPPPNSTTAYTSAATTPVETQAVAQAATQPAATNITPAAPVAAAPASTATASTTAATPTNISMSWPVKGPVLSSFGPKGQGLNNDGINIGAPKGAPVVAAANGIVVYAGNEMKGFGNLILIRHEGGWVTAYAHLDRTLVNKDAVVNQGDMIGTVGKTGDVPSPQLHFETRYAGKPVDPATVIKAQ
jgi:murein DD-endopeptidase MepM/ murein hydrolase activator NlpD